jgi:hypothetical protein
VGFPAIYLAQIEACPVGEGQVLAIGRDRRAGDGSILWVGGKRSLTDGSLGYGAWPKHHAARQSPQSSVG